MAAWHEAFWESDVTNAPRRERRSGSYRWYEPDRVVGRPLAISAELSLRIALVERRLRGLDGPGADLLSSVSRLLLRSEAIASSRIEGVSPSAEQVALAELGTTEEVQGLSAQAKLVANNLTVVQDAAGLLAERHSAVSYTHLDVYKRQPYTWATPAFIATKTPRAVQGAGSWSAQYTWAPRERSTAMSASVVPMSTPGM